jgi:hypothetical protein
MTSKTTEALIIAALFRATVEQSNHFNREFKGVQNKEFKNWQNKGYKVMGNIGMETSPLLTSLTEGIENCVNEFRKELNRLNERKNNGRK